MKNALCVVLIAALSVFMSVTTFAADPIPVFPTAGVSIENGNTVISVFDILGSSQAVKDYMDDFFASEKARFVSYNFMDGIHWISFFKYDVVPSTPLSTGIASGKHYVSPGNNVCKIIKFSFQPSTGLWKPSSDPYLHSVGGLTFDSILTSNIDINVPSSFYYSYSGLLVYRDNVNGDDGDDGSSGIPDPVIPGNPVPLPTIPTVTNKYIPYDTSRWNGFLSWVTSAIGNTTNIGLLLFGIILAILVVIRIVRLFSR